VSASAESLGTLLGGRVIYAQQRAGYRTGIEPVLLAAAIPARPGERVLEAGTGAGAGLLCLAARLPEISATGIERDPDLARLAGRNIAANHWAARLTVEARDITAAATGGPAFDHACANPPWHDRRATPSPNPLRRAAKRAAPGLLDAWAAALAAALRPRGSLTLILPAGALAAGLAALERAGCGAARLLPLWPKPGRAARLILLQARRAATGPCQILPGLTLHTPGGGYTEAAEAILRHGAALDLGTVASR